MSTGVALPAGIDVIGSIRWGTHLCQVYESDEDLIKVLVQFFQEGLDRNALCLWVSSLPLQQEVLKALRLRIPHFDECERRGQIEAIPHTEWYLRDGKVNASAAAERALSVLNQATVLGYDGLWTGGDLSWLNKKDWPSLVSYEEKVCDLISGSPIVALCAYPLQYLSILEGLDLFKIHRSIVIKREGKWKLIESLEQIKVEKTLQDTERIYKHLFDNTLDGIEMIDGTTGRVLIANKAAAGIFGFSSPEQMVGIDPLAYIPSEDRARVANLIADSMFGKNLRRIMELRALRTDGSEIWISARGVRTEYQGKLAGLISIRDITEQRKAERAWLESQRELKAVFDGVRDGIAILDLTGKVVAVNKRVLDVGDYAEDDIVGKTFDQLEMFGSEGIAKFLSVVDTVLSGHDAPPLEIEASLGSGIKLVLDVRITPLMRGNDVTGGIAVLRDITQWKRAVAQLQASEQRNRLLVDNANEGIIVVQDNFIKFANRKALEILKFYGYMEEEIASRPFVEFIHPEDRDFIVENYARRLAGEEFGHVYSFRAVGKTGQTRWIELNVVRLLWEGKLSVLAFINDVTERKEAEEELRKREEEFKALAENATDLVARYDRQRRHLYINSTIQRLTGIQREAFIGKTNGELGAPEELVRFWEESGLTVFDTGQEKVIEYEMPTLNGHGHFEARLTPEFSKDGLVESVLAVSRDITDRKHSEDALRESESRYRLLAENISDVIWVTDPDLRLTYISPSIERLTGFTVEESLSHGLKDGLSLSSADRALDVFAQWTTDPTARMPLQSQDFEIKRKDGSTIWINTTVNVIRGENGLPIQFLGVIREITERKRAEEQLQESYTKLEKTLDGTIQAIRSMVDTRDRYTAGHQQRVTELACAIASIMGLSSEQIRAIRIAGLLHDVGKITLPTEILTKPGRLNEIEIAMVKTHPNAGYEILKSVEFPQPIAEMVAQHHERMDGSGYPEGLRGEEILLEARILAVADVVEAMYSHRPYRPALGLDKALDEIASKKGILYDSRVVDACMRVFQNGGFNFTGDAATAQY